MMLMGDGRWAMSNVLMPLLNFASRGLTPRVPPLGLGEGPRQSALRIARVR
jgi:hypothetical protein